MSTKITYYHLFVKYVLVNFLVKLLHNTAKQYYKDYGECCRIPFINYEDLYFLAKQVHDDYTGEMENPAIHQFSRDLVQVVSQRIESRIHTEETHDFRLSDVTPFSWTVYGLGFRQFS